MNNLTITEFRNIRVLTTQQLAECYETETKVISNNFNRNKERYEEGKHYISLEGEEKREYLNHHQIEDGSKNASKIYLWTEKGAFLHAKSLNTDKAWEVYDILVDTYFKHQNILSNLSPELQAIFAHDKKLQIIVDHISTQEQKITDVNQDLQTFKMDMPILGIECDRITAAVKSKGVKCLGGKESNAYQDKSLRGKVYSDIYGQLKREFGLSASYKAIKRSQTDVAVAVIEAYELPMALEEEISDLNAQMVMQ